MKNSYRILAGLALLAFSLFLFQKNKTTEAKQAKPIQIGERSESPADRKAMELEMLASPKTGRIPQGIQFFERDFLTKMQTGVAERGNAPDWISRGPWNYGGRTRAMEFDVMDENRIMAGGVSGGIWLSEDAGQSWERKSNVALHPGVVSIAQDKRPGHTNKWYAMSGELYGTSASGGGAFYLGDGLFKSLDNGQNWTAVTSTDNGQAHVFTQLFQGGWRVICGQNPNADEIYLATYGAIYRSANGGQSWTTVLGGLDNTFSYFTDVTMSSDGVFYATLSSDGPDKGIWRSTDGITWSDITPADFPTEYDRIVMGINPDNEDEVYFLGTTPNAGHYTNYIGSDDWTSLWKYTYIGGNGAGMNGTWEDRSLNLPSTGTEFDQFSAQGGYDLVVRVQPGTGNVFVGGTSLYRSTDAFTTPDNTTMIGGYKPGTKLPFFEIYDNHHPDIHDVQFLPSDANVLLSASDGGLHRSNDALAQTVVWESLNRGYQTTQFYSAFLDKKEADDELLIGCFQDNGNLFAQSFGPTSNWVQTVNGDGCYGAVAEGKDYFILSIQRGRVAKCEINSDGTVTAFERIDPVGRVQDDYRFINPLIMDPNDDNIIYLPSKNALFRNDDLANIPLTGTWDSISQGWTMFPDTLTSGEISCIAASESNPAHRLYFGTNDNQLFRVDDAHTGTPNFTAITPPAGDDTWFVNCIAIDPENADDIVVVYSNYEVYSLWRSLDAGQTWIKVGGNLEATVGGAGNGPSVRWVSILPMPDGSRTYFAGTSVGLFSTDTLLLHTNPVNGTQWTQEAAQEIGSTVVPFVDVRALDGTVIAATHGNGLFSTNYFNFVPTKEPQAADIGLKLWPNPVVGNTITLDLQNGDYEGKPFQIFNMEGKLLQTVVLTTGQQSIDVAHLKVGLYQCSYGLRFVKQ